MRTGLLEKPDSLGSFLTDSIFVKDYDRYLLIHSGQSSFLREKVLALGPPIRHHDSVESPLFA